MPDGSQFVRDAYSRNLPPDIADRLIVALDVDTVEDAQKIVNQLDGTVSFFKIGLWLFLKPGVNQFIDKLIRQEKKVFLDYKMFDIGETVKIGVESAASRGISFLTVHGDTEIMSAAVAGRGETSLKIFAVSVLTSLSDGALAQMGYNKSVKELIHMRVKSAVSIGCDGIIASPNDSPDELRQIVNSEKLLIATPGIRMADEPSDDHARAGNPADAIFNGADYLVVGRHIVRNADPLSRARLIIAEMTAGHERRVNAGL